MDTNKNELLRCSFLSEEEDILVKMILLCHDPDGRQIDSQMLLRILENVMFYATISSVLVSKPHLATMAVDIIYNNEEVGDLHETLGQIIYIISKEVQSYCSGNRDLHTKTITLFDMLGNFSWDAKMVIALAAFVSNYGELLLTIQLYPQNPLALSVAMLKQLPNNLSAFRPQLKALRVLVQSIVDATKCIIEFEALRRQHIKIDEKETFTTKSYIYIAAYWVIRSTLTCSSLVTDLTANNQEQVNLSSTTAAAWELSSLVCKMRGICGYLCKQVAICHLQIEDKVHQKLLKLFSEPQVDNQELLCTLFALKDDMPLKLSSVQHKLSVSILLNKVVLLLISKPDILPLEDLIFLVQQTYRLPHHDDLERSYEIVWVPITSSSTWTDTDTQVFYNLSNILPWYSLRQPWLLNSEVVKYIKQAWNFVDEPMMVVLDPRGAVSSPNAISMVFIWGSMAYPFSILREQQLWDEANWSLKLILDEIDPLTSMKIDEGRTIFLYGSDDLEWIRKFTRKIKEIISTGVQLEVVYVGKKKPGKSISYTLAAITREKLSGYLSLYDIHLLWLRLKSIQRSKHQIGMSTDTDSVLKEVESLLSHEDNSWALLGEGLSPDTLLYDGSDVLECINLFPVWAQNIGRVGFIGAMKSALEPPPLTKPCCRCNVVPYVEGSIEGSVVCEECKRPMEKFILYQCQGTE
ncbi:Sieve element occlusion c [Thalictrum thalictroides]|uniref:Sieve element occlusion c n=1 Tax=Thalictrum thalictroides TaxID=46969 RepID=A0A7J6VCH3_THATH|nr:Sieve element occlusion c [Thalictrum thalictroides]